MQYHEVVYELCGRWLGTISWVVNVLALLGLAVAQVIACANNMYRLSSVRTKRWGATSYLADGMHPSRGKRWCMSDASVGWGHSVGWSTS